MSFDIPKRSLATLSPGNAPSLDLLDSLVALTLVGRMNLGIWRVLPLGYRTPSSRLPGSSNLT